jgi:hypothetical protein
MISTILPHPRINPAELLSLHETPWLIVSHQVAPINQALDDGPGQFSMVTIPLPSASSLLIAQFLTTLAHFLHTIANGHGFTHRMMIDAHGKPLLTISRRPYLLG